MNIPTPYRLDGGYLFLPIPDLKKRLPSTLKVGGKSFNLKDEFHVTLIGTSDNVAWIPEARACEIFTEYVAEHPIVFQNFVDEFRHAKKEERESIVVRCRVSNLAMLFERLSAEANEPVPLQPTHVTLYTFPSSRGIGISSEEAMQQYEQLELLEIFATLAT